jgi:hypothetical protein
MKITDVTVESYEGRYHVVASDEDGRVYTHERDFKDHEKAQSLADKVEAKGVIDTEHWHTYVPYGTEAWLKDDMEVTLMDDEERHHKGLW